MSGDNSGGNRRTFLKTAGVLAVAAACSPSTNANETSANTSTQRGPGFAAATHQALLVSVGSAVLPESLGDAGQARAVAQFTAWCDGYDPVAEEMHGYGYADVRYLPPDPVPAWRAQLDGLDVLAQRVHHTAFGALSLGDRRAIISMATRRVRGDRLPSPLGAEHVTVALLAHWAASPDAWNRAFHANVSPGTCRPLGDGVRKPLPVAVVTGALHENSVAVPANGRRA